MNLEEMLFEMHGLVFCFVLFSKALAREISISSTTVMYIILI